MAGRQVKPFIPSIEESEHERDVKIAICSVAIMGLAAAAGLVRPFKRFRRPSDIPNRFIRFRTKLYGNVQRIEPTGPLLMVQHKPVIPILPRKVDPLPVKISGISINSNGISWLQAIVASNNVTFVPMLKQKDCVQCEVTMDQKTKDDKIKEINIAANLVQIGFGTLDEVDKTLVKNVFYQKYIKKLKSAETVAEKRRLGYWYYVTKTQKSALKLIRFLMSLTKTSKPITSKKPKELSGKIASA